MNLPWVAVALWLAARSVPHRSVVVASARFDAVGAIGLSALLAGFAWLLNPGNVSAQAPPLAAIALAGLAVAFVRYELGRADPVLQPRFLRVRAFTASTASVALSNLALYGTLLAVPVLLSHRAGWSDADIGLGVGAMSFPMAVLSPFGGWLSDHAGRRLAAVAGLAVLAAALVPLALAGGNVAGPVLIASLAAAGAGIGLSNAPVQTASIEALAPHDAGVAAGIFSTGRYLGGIAAASLVAALASGARDRYGLLFTMEALAALLSMLCATALPGRRHASVMEQAAARAPAT